MERFNRAVDSAHGGGEGASLAVYTARPTPPVRHSIRNSGGICYYVRISQTAGLNHNVSTRSLEKCLRHWYTSLHARLFSTSFHLREFLFASETAAPLPLRPTIHFVSLEVFHVCFYVDA